MADVEARIAEVTEDASLRAVHYTRLGDALSSTNSVAARNAYKKALDLQPDSLAAIRGLSAVGSALGEPQTMVEAYRREARWRRDDRAAADLYVQASTVLARLGSVDEAIADAERALGQCPDHAAAAEQLRYLLLRKGAIDRLVELLSQAAHMAKDAERKVWLWRNVGAIHADRRNDLGAAINAVKRALDAQPKDLKAILQMADLHERDNQHREAADLLNRSIQIDPANVDAHKRLARIYTEFIRDHERAYASLGTVLAADAQDRDALRMLFVLHLDGGDREKARAVSQQLLEAAGDDDEMRAWALVEIGRSELKAGDLEQAAEALHHAVVLTGISGKAVQAYRKLLGSKEPWTRYVDALRQYIKRAERKHIDPTELAQVFLEIASTEHRHLDRADAAFQTLEQGISRCGDQPALSLQRAEMLINLGRHGEAVTAFQTIVAHDPLVSEAWRALARALQHQARKAEASVAVGPLLMLGVASDVERNLAAERGLRPGTARPGSFGPSTLRTLSAGNGEDEERVAGVFGAVADGLSKAFPPQLDLYGVRKSDRIKPRTGHPMRQEVDRISAAFGLEDVELYVHAGMGGDVAVELADPPALMVPTYLSEVPDAQRVFLVGRGLAAIASGLHPAFRLNATDVGLVLAAAVRRLVPSFEDGNHDHDRLVLLTDKLSPSWFGRGRVDEVVQRYYAEPVDALKWAPTVAYTVTRAAALLAGDLESVVAAMRLAGTIPGELEGVEMVRQTPVLLDLLRFWVSDQASEVRRVAGII